jgi:hypothetical protein
MNTRLITFTALVLLGVTAFSWKWDSASTVSTAPAAKSAPATEVAAPRAVPSTTTLSTLNPLANLDPFATLALNRDSLSFARHANSLHAMREIRRGKTLSEAQVVAAMSDDPLVHVNSFFMMFPCMNESVRAVRRDVGKDLAEYSRDPKTGAPRTVSKEELEFAELRANGGPQRISPPKEIREEIRKEIDEPIEERMARFDRGERDIAKEMRLWRANLAPLTNDERGEFDAIRSELAKACDNKMFSNEFGAAYRAQRDKLAAQGVISALIFNEKAGWTSTKHLGELSERDYALVERGIKEQHPDVLAALLLRGSLHADASTARLPDDEYAARIVLQFHAVQMAACALSVSDCSRESRTFQESCLMVGGCDQPDAFALWRYVLARDGLDPAAVDRVVADLVAKIRAGDLDALGIRRKK